MDLLRHGRPRVVITGLGAVSPLGHVDTLWQALLNGQSGIRQLTSLDTSHVNIKIGGEVLGFDPEQYVDRKEARRMARVSQFAVAAAKMAAADAGLDDEARAARGERMGVVMGTTMGPHLLAEDTTYRYKQSGYRKPNPIAFANTLPNMPTHHVSRELGTLGPLATPSAACASGTQALGEGADLIRHGRADVIFAGGTEALMADYVIAGFDAMSALATGYNDNPAAASRPFDRDRNGFVFSEASGVLVLESMAHALARGAHIYGEVLGWASSSDAFHVAALPTDGAGAARCMRWALEDAHVAAKDVGYINAHGSSTPANDAIETLAIKHVFGEHAYDLAVSSTKSMLGHALAATGALEAIASVLALVHQVLPPTINYTTPDPDCDLDYVPNVARQVQKLRRVVSNSFGLGGQNASAVLGAL